MVESVEMRKPSIGDRGAVEIQSLELVEGAEVSQVRIGHQRPPAVDRDHRTTWACHVALDASPKGSKPVKGGPLLLIIGLSVLPRRDDRQGGQDQPGCDSRLDREARPPTRERVSAAPVKTFTGVVHLRHPFRHQ